MVCIALGKQQNTENQKPSTLKNRPHERKFTLRQFIWILLEFWKIIDKVQLQKNGVTLQKSHLTRAGNLLLRIISSCYYSNSGPFKYYVIKQVGGWGQKMAIFDGLQYCKSSEVGEWALKSQKHDDVILEWSLRRSVLLLLQIETNFKFNFLHDEEEEKKN